MVSNTKCIICLNEWLNTMLMWKKHQVLKMLLFIGQKWTLCWLQDQEEGASEFPETTRWHKTAQTKTRCPYWMTARDGWWQLPCGHHENSMTFCLMHWKCNWALKYTPVTQSVLCLILLIYVRTTQSLNYGGQESFFFFKLQLMILTHLWPWNKVKVIKTSINW